MWKQKLCAHLPLAQVTLLREEKLVLLTLVMLSRLRPWPKGQGGSVWAGGTTEGRVTGTENNTRGMEQGDRLNHLA